MNAGAEGFVVALVGFYVALISFLSAAHGPKSLTITLLLGIVTIVGGILYAVFKSRYEVKRRR